MIKIITGRPKRKSGVWARRLLVGAFGTYRKESGNVFDLDVVQKLQREIGSTLFEGREFKLIPYE